MAEYILTVDQPNCKHLWDQPRLLCCNFLSALFESAVAYRLAQGVWDLFFFFLRNQEEPEAPTVNIFKKQDYKVSELQSYKDQTDQGRAKERKKSRVSQVGADP